MRTDEPRTDEPQTDKPQTDERPVDEPATARVRPGSPARRLAALAGRVRGRVPGHWIFVAALFVGSKLVLTLVGLVAIHAFVDEPVAAPPPSDAQMRVDQRTMSPHRWISMWFAYDSFIYHRIAGTPLDGAWDEFAFPLLYPFLARPVAALLGGDRALALLLVANVAYLFALYYAYRLAERVLGDDAAARRFTTYVVLMPAAFLFHAALTESLFLCLALAAFYHAERRRWLVVGIVGFFLALSRSVGFLVVIPLALLLLQQGGYRLGPRALWGYVRTGWPLLLVPAGWLTFMAFCRVQGGDWFAYQRAQERGWGIVVQNPLRTVWDGLTVAPGRDTDRVLFALVLVAVVAAGLRWLAPAYLAYTLIMVAVPLSIGPPVYRSLLRYLLAAFPACLVLARWAARATLHTYLTATLALVQGAVFVLWLTYWTHFIV